jgi:hypothetical protein
MEHYPLLALVFTVKGVGRIVPTWAGWQKYTKFSLHGHGKNGVTQIVLTVSNVHGMHGLHLRLLHKNIYL